MRTCRIADYFHRHLHADEVHAIADNIDIIASVFSLDCSSIAGLGHLGTLEFGPNLNVLHGESASGKTRLLEHLKSNSSGVETLPALPTTPHRDLSQSQTLMRVIQSLVAVQPEDTSCLLLDDVLDLLTDEQVRWLIELLVGNRGKQSILTVKPHRMHLVRQCVGRKSALIEETDTTPALMQCWY